MRAAAFRRGVIAASVCLLMLGVGGCGGNDNSGGGGATARGSFVGEVPGTGASVAVVAGSQAAAALVTNGGHGITETFGGARRGSRVKLKSSHSAVLDVKLSDAGGSGKVVLEGRSHAVSLKPARPRAGLYRAAGRIGKRPVWVGWVVLNDGRQRGSANDGKRSVDAPRLNTANQTIRANGKRQKVDKLEPDSRGRASKLAARGVFKGGSGFQGGGFGGQGQFGGGGGGFQGQLGGFGQFGGQGGGVGGFGGGFQSGFQGGGFGGQGQFGGQGGFGGGGGKGVGGLGGSFLGR
jgi:hypothetical protein